MKIAIDFDDTYTVMPSLMNEFISLCDKFGYEVYCVTLRHERNLDEVFSSIGRLIPHDNVIATGGKAKEDYCRNLGIFINVWIDDTPLFINTSPYTYQQRDENGD